MEVPHGEILGVVAPFDDRFTSVGPSAVEIDGGEERLSGFVTVVAAQSRLQVAGLFGRDGLQMTYTAGERPHPAGGQGAEYRLAQVGEKADGLEQLPAAELRRAVVHPDPEPVLDPLEVERPGDRRLLGEGVGQEAVPVPQDLRVLGPLGEVGGSDELEVDMQ
ncbi:hypothetical protein [Streptomyces sp. NPDC003660]